MLSLLDPSRQLVIGHRGNRAHAPEDTLESFAQAVALGVDALECDVHLSRDGVPVVIHDPSLDRTTAASGAVRQWTRAELAGVDAGARFSPDGGKRFPYRGRGIGVPALEDVLDAFRDLPLIIEIKVAEASAPVLALLERRGDSGRVLIGSFLESALRPFRAAGLAVGSSVDAMKPLYLPALLGARPAVLPFQAMIIPRRHGVLPLPVTRFARMMAARGGPTHVWTVNDPAEAQALWRRGVNGILSDNPAAILAARRSLR